MTCYESMGFHRRRSDSALESWSVGRPGDAMVARRRTVPRLRPEPPLHDRRPWAWVACTSWRAMVTTHHQVAAPRAARLRPRPWARVALRELVTTHHQVAATAGRASSTGAPGARSCASWRELVTTHHEVAATAGRAVSTGAPGARVALRELAQRWSPRITRLRRAPAALLRSVPPAPGSPERPKACCRSAATPCGIERYQLGSLGPKPLKAHASARNC